MAIWNRQQGDSAVSQLDHLLEESRDLKRAFEPYWLLNIAYFSGQQWTKCDGYRVSPVSLAAGRQRLTDNRIQGIIRTEIAKMTKDRPVFVTTPRTGAQEDYYAARLGDRFLDYQWNHLSLQRRLKAALLWSRICGAGFLKVYWDSTKGTQLDLLAGPDGQPVYDDATGAPVQAGDLPQIPEGYETTRLNTGDFCVETISPFSFFQSPLCGEEGLENAEWAGEESIQSAEYMRRRYNVELEEDEEALQGVSGLSLPGVTFAQMPNKRAKGVKVRELWMVPSTEHPQGRHVVWAKDHIVHEDVNPYPWLPYVMFSGISVPGRFWPTSVTEQLISPQTEMNKRRSQMSENADRIGNPAVAKNRQSNVEWNGAIGEEVLYDDLTGNTKPFDFIRAPELPAFVSNEISFIETSFREVSGQHEVTSGNVPAGVTAASAINLLQEQDDTRLGPDISDMEMSLGQLGSKILWIAGRFMKVEETIRIAGEDEDWDIFKFQGQLLKSHDNVEVQAGSAFPRSKAAKQAAIKDMLNLIFQYGVPVKERDLRKLFRAYEVGGLEILFNSLGETEGQINRENRALAMGAAFPPNDYDDHPAHIDAHQEEMRSLRFEQYEPQIKQNYLDHVKMHMMMVNPMPLLPEESNGSSANGSPSASVPFPLADLKES